MDGIMEGSGKKKNKITERMSADDLLTDFATKVKRGSAHHRLTTTAHCNTPFQALVEHSSLSTVTHVTASLRTVTHV